MARSRYFQYLSSDVICKRKLKKKKKKKIVQHTKSSSAGYNCHNLNKYRQVLAAEKGRNALSSIETGLIGIASIAAP